MNKTSLARKASAFTLIELMVAMAIVGVLAMIAFPNYRAYNVRTRRAEAETILVQDAAFMERLYTQAGCYNPGPDNQCGNADDIAPACPPLPYCQSPSQGIAFYNVAFSAITATTYALRATPVVGGSQERDGIVQITSTGVQWWDKNNNGALDAGEDTWLSR